MTRPLLCDRAEAFAPEVCRQRNQNEADADLPPDHGLRPRGVIDEAGAFAERVADGSGDQEQCRERSSDRTPAKAGSTCGCWNVFPGRAKPPEWRRPPTWASAVPWCGFYATRSRPHRHPGRRCRARQDASPPCEPASDQSVKTDSAPAAGTSAAGRCSPGSGERWWRCRR